MTDEQLIEAMCLRWYGPPWAGVRWNNSTKGAMRSLMADILAIVEPEIRRRERERNDDLPGFKDGMYQPLWREATPPEPSGNPGELPDDDLPDCKDGVHQPHCREYVPPAPKCATCGGSVHRWNCTNGTGRAKEKP